MPSIELFAGAGGLALGTARAGFFHDAVIEWDQYACDTLRENQSLGVAELQGCNIFRGDVREVDFSTFGENIDLLSGGPPCQPFSLGGKHKGFLDERDMFPATIRAVRELKPKVVVVENVKGLLRSSFSDYFRYIVLQLSYPEVALGEGETWVHHLSRLEQQHTAGRHDGLEYNVVYKKLNSADYGVPQKRERVFFVCFRADLGVEWSFEKDVPATHSSDALLYDQWVSGDYWERHEVPLSQRPKFPSKSQRKIDMLKGQLFFDGAKPWRTVRDAICDMPNPRTNPRNEFLNHVYIPGAKVYPGHTGSPMDEPSKTLKAGDHGVPGGENMLVHPNGKVRYFTVREAARIQTFPDDYYFHGSWTEIMRQLGNAVPVELGRAVAKSVYEKLEEIRLSGRVSDIA